jgi:hypothetical protein
MLAKLTNGAREIADMSAGVAGRSVIIERLAVLATAGAMAAIGVKFVHRQSVSACGGYDCNPVAPCPSANCNPPDHLFYCTSSCSPPGYLCWDKPCAHFCTTFC